MFKWRFIISQYFVHKSQTEMDIICTFKTGIEVQNFSKTFDRPEIKKNKNKIV